MFSKIEKKYPKITEALMQNKIKANPAMLAMLKQICGIECDAQGTAKGIRCSNGSFKE